MSSRQFIRLAQSTLLNRPIQSCTSTSASIPNVVASSFSPLSSIPSSSFSTSAFSTTTPASFNSSSSTSSPSSSSSTSFPSSSSSSSSSTVPSLTRSTAGGVSLSNLTKPGGRSSVSGIVATVFGSTGFLGNYIVSNLGRIGSQVIVPYRGEGLNARQLKLAGDLGQIVPIPYEMADEESVKRVVSRSNVVVNALGSQFETTNYSFHDTNVKCVYRIAKLAKEAGVERFIHISCVGADINSKSSYYRSKGEGEAAVKHFFPNATILRPTIMYGDEDRFINYISTIGTRLTGIPVVNNGNQKMQPVYVIDVARAVLGAIQYEDAIGRTFELGGPDIYAYKNIVRLVNHSGLMDVKLTNLPDSIARIYGRILGGEAIQVKPDSWKITKLLSLVTRRLRMTGIFFEDRVDQSYVNIVCNPSLPGLEDLGVAPTNLVNIIDELMISRRDDQVAPERFPDANKIKEEAMGTHN